MGAGDFTLKEAKLGEVKIEVGAGNCSIEGDVSEELKADCAMGNITLKLEGKETDYDYELVIKSNFPGLLIFTAGKN